MSITLGPNIVTLRALRSFDEANDLVATLTRRLASGQRINSASDDAAGLAVATALHTTARIATVAIQNVSQGISLLSLEDSAFQSIDNILHRMAELAQQSSNGTYTTMQRSPIQAEFTALASEIERIARTTEYNNIPLLSASHAITLQVGFNAYSVSQITLQGNDGTLQSLALAGSGSSALIYSVNGVNNLEAQAAARTALAAIEAAIGTVESRRGMVGASESRLDTALNNLVQQRENFKVAESRITDINVAADAAQLLAAQIRQQAATAILAQANQHAGDVRKLLS